MPSSVSIANTMPPLAEPSSLVSTTPVDVGRLGELPRLREAVLAGRGVDHEQHLGDVARLAGGHPAHLAQLLHQVRLGVEPTGGVAEHEVDVRVPRPRCDPVEDDRARVAALVAPHEVGAGPLGPRRRAARRPRRGTCRRRPAARERPSATCCAADLADGGGLADAVDADEQPHVGRAVARRRRGAARGRRRRGGPSSRRCSASSSCVGLGDLLGLHPPRGGRRAARR